jgi:hypothetical protein
MATDMSQAWIDQWATELKIPTHLLSTQKWEELFRVPASKT